MYANTYCLHNLYNSTVVGWGGGLLFTGFIVLFSWFSISILKKGVQVIIILKLKIRIMTSVTMLKHTIIYKRRLVIFNKSCLKRLKLSALDTLILLQKSEQRGFPTNTFAPALVLTATVGIKGWCPPNSIFEYWAIDNLEFTKGMCNYYKILLNIPIYKRYSWIYS